MLHLGDRLLPNKLRLEERADTADVSCGEARVQLKVKIAEGTQRRLDKICLHFKILHFSMKSSLNNGEKTLQVAQKVISIGGYTSGVRSLCTINFAHSVVVWGIYNKTSEIVKRVQEWRQGLCCFVFVFLRLTCSL